MVTQWLPLVTAAMSGGGVGWLTTFLSDKSKSRAYTMGAVDQAVKVALESVTSEVERLNRELGKLRLAHAECQAKNEQLQKDQEELRDNIDKLMKGEVPGYVRSS